MSAHFTSTIYQYGTHIRVDVPAHVSRAFNEKGYIAVHGTLNGAGIRGTLTPVAAGKHVLYINHQMAMRAGVSVGQSVELDLDRDREQRKPLPKELIDALEADQRAKAAWQSLPVGRRKRLVSYLNWFSTQTTRERKVERIVRDLRRTSLSE